MLQQQINKHEDIPCTNSNCRCPWYQSSTARSQNGEEPGKHGSGTVTRDATFY